MGYLIYLFIEWKVYLILNQNHGQKSNLREFVCFTWHFQLRSLSSSHRLHRRTQLQDIVRRLCCYAGESFASRRDKRGTYLRHRPTFIFYRNIYPKSRSITCQMIHAPAFLGRSNFGIRSFTGCQSSTIYTSLSVNFLLDVFDCGLNT